MYTNRLETQTQTFWKLSRAWKRDPVYAANMTYSKLITGLNPLIIQGDFHPLRTQAEELSEMVCKAKIRRPKGKGKGQVVHVDFKAKTKKLGHKKQAA